MKPSAIFLTKINANKGRNDSWNARKSKVISRESLETPIGRTKIWKWQPDSRDDNTGLPRGEQMHDGVAIFLTYVRNVNW